MDELKNEVPILEQYARLFGKAIGIQVTLNCPLNCAHCIVSSSPQRKEEIPTEKVVKWISEIGETDSIKLIFITGGEPFVNINKLEKISKSANEYGLFLHIVTNAFWAKSYNQAKKILNKLQGITNLAISTDTYHVKYIPFEFIKNASLAALDNGIEVGISICITKNDTFQNTLEKEFGKELLDKLLIVTQKVHATGRARDLSMMEKKVFVDKYPLKSCSNLATPFILYDGTVMACCGDVILNPDMYTPLKLGKMSQTSLKEILDKADQSFLIHALRMWGPAELYKRIKNKNLISCLKKSYPMDNMCELCCNLLTQPDIVNHLIEEINSPEVQREIALARALQYGELSMINTTKSL